MSRISLDVGNVGLFLTTYDGEGTTTDLLTGTSTLNAGYSSEYFPADTPIVIDNAFGAYSITATMDPNKRFCGARVFISSP